MSVVIAGVIVTVLTVLGLLFNGYTLLVLLLTKQLQTANNVLLFHLGVVELLLCLVALFFTSPSYLRGNWIAGVALCQLQGFLFTCLHPVVVWTLCGLSCDRYCAISTPLHYSTRVNPRKTAIFILSAWLLGVLLSLPPLFVVGSYRYSPGLGGCKPDFTTGGPLNLGYTVCYTFLSIFLPSGLILVCNMKILMIARYHRHRIVSAIYEVTLSAQATITHQRNPFYLAKFRGRSAIVTIVQLVGSLVATYYPFFGIVIWEAVTQYPAPLLPSVVASLLLASAPTLNGLVYGLKSRLLRKTFRNYLRKKVCKNEVQQEIQARTPSNHGSRRPSLTPLGLLMRPPLSAANGRPLRRRLSEEALNSRSSCPCCSSTTACNCNKPPRLQRIASELWPNAGSTSFRRPAPSSPGLLREMWKALKPLPTINTTMAPPPGPLMSQKTSPAPRILVTRVPAASSCSDAIGYSSLGAVPNNMQEQQQQQKKKFRKCASMDDMRKPHWWKSRSKNGNNNNNGSSKSSKSSKSSSQSSSSWRNLVLGSAHQTESLVPPAHC